MRKPWNLIAWAAVLLTVRPAPAQETRTFVYAKTKEAALEMIVHLPPGWKATDRRPVVIFFFGGGWTNGSVKQFEPQAEHLAKRGLVAARADYRVKSRHGVTPDRCVADARSALRWLKANAATLGIDPDKVIASGGSAGGHIAACTFLAEGPENDGADLKIAPRPAAMVLFNPVLRFEGVAKLQTRLGKKEDARVLSPVLFITRETPPTLLLYGDKDALIEQGQEFLTQAKKLGARAEMFTAEGEGHGFFNREPWRSRTIERMDAFLATLGYLAAAK